MKRSSRISLIVCTRDRAASLDRLLESVQAGDAARVGAQVVIVDNGSSYGCNAFDRRVVMRAGSFLESGTIQGTCMLFSSRLVRVVGGFDPMFGPGTPWRCDDIDYCQRASWAGFTAAHEPRIFV